MTRQTLTAPAPPGHHSLRDRAFPGGPADASTRMALRVVESSKSVDLDAATHAALPKSPAYVD